MTSDQTNALQPLRIYCVEDNPLIVFHLQSMIEDVGHRFVGFSDSFLQMKNDLDVTDVDGVLIDIDLIDGRTGPAAAAWLKERGVPSIFLTGQVEIAAGYDNLTLGVITKPIQTGDFAHGIGLFRNHTGSD